MVTDGEPAADVAADSPEPAVPTVAATEHLRLRPLVAGDIHAFLELQLVEDVWGAFGKVAPPSTVEVKALLDAMIAGHGALGPTSSRHSVAIEMLEDQAFVGVIDLTAIGDLGDFSIAITPTARGNGYSVEALAAFFDWCSAERGVTTIVGTAQTGNAASIATMLAAGMLEVDAGAKTKQGEPVDSRTFQWEAPD